MGEILVELFGKTAMKAAVKPFHNPASALMLLLALLLICCHSNFVSAASAGRMGGSAFHSPSRPSRSSKSSITFTSPSRSSTYGCTGGCRGANSSNIISEFSLNPLAVIVVLLVLVLVCVYLAAKYLEDDTRKTASVIKLQVGMAGLATRSLQKDLNLIAETADTSTPKGLHYVLTETIVTVLQHCDYCISTYSLVDVKSREDGEKVFNRLSIEERGKFDEETLVNVNNKRKWSSTIQRTSGYKYNSEYIVITILAVVGGVYKQPRIHSRKELKEALQNMASILPSQTLAVEVLWTPQKENDILSEQELQRDYPLLLPLF